MFRWEGEAFVDMGVLPPVPSDVSNDPYAGFAETNVLFGPNDAWFGGSIRDWTAPDESVPRNVHFDGSAWKNVFALPGEPLPLFFNARDRVVFQGFPKDLNIIGGVYFDGARFHPLGVPPPNGVNGTYFWSSSGRLATIAEFSGTGTTPIAYREVMSSNGDVYYEMIDARGEIDVKFAVLEWDSASSAWFKTRDIGTSKACIGIACGYGGGTSALGVRAALSDNTIVVQVNEEGDSSEGHYLYLVDP